MGWGYEESAIAAFLDSLEGRLTGAEPVLVYIDDDPAQALERAIDREGPTWKDWFLGKLASYPVDPPVRGLESAIDYLRHERELTLRLLARMSWQVVVINQSDPASASDVQRMAREQLGPIIGERAQQRP